MTYSTKETEVRIPSAEAGTELVGILIEPEKERVEQSPAVLFVHGMPDGPDSQPLRSMRPRMERLSEKGFVTAAFACRGVGGSGGEFGALSDHEATKDTGAAFRWLRSQDNVRKDRVGLWGSSWGGYLSTMSLSDIDPASLFLSVPALYEETRYSEPFSNSSLESRRAFRSDFQGRKHEAFARLASYNHPFFVVIAGADEMVPINCQIGYLAELGNHAASDAYVLIGSRHIIKEDPKAEEKLRTLISDWFTRTLC